MPAMLGTSTVVAGLSCVPTGPASLQVVVNEGSIYQLDETDATAYGRLTWLALVELSSPSLPADARAELESKIVAGSRFTHTQIRARRPLKKPARMAA
jgi:hypothetical protein